MLKRFIYSLLPDVIIHRYKVYKYYEILKNHDIYNQPELLVAQELVNDNSLFVDIGANIGLYTIILSPLVKQVISIEPVPFTYQMLNTMLQKFSLNNVQQINSLFLPLMENNLLKFQIKQVQKIIIGLH